MIDLSTVRDAAVIVLCVTATYALIPLTYALRDLADVAHAMLDEARGRAGNKFGEGG
jgi:hypothetical protein